MPKATTIRFTEDDLAVLAELQALTGLHSASDAIRLAIREAVASRRTTPPRKSKR